MQLDDLPRSGKPLEMDLDVLKQLIEEDPRLTARRLTDRLRCVHATVETHLKGLGKRWKYGVCIPHCDELEERSAREMVADALFGFFTHVAMTIFRLLKDVYRL